MFHVVGQITLNLSVFDSKAHNFRAFMNRITQGADTERRVFSVPYESTLAFVSSPDLEQWNSPGLDRVTFEDRILDRASEPISRIDFSKVLEWLRDIYDVQNIIELNVRDSMMYPHPEEAIERAVKGFNVEKLHWKRLDLSIHSVREAAPNVRELTLYSSGNMAAFYHWFSPDGLVTLGKVCARPARITQY
jgi:hypothetical protein